MKRLRSFPMHRSRPRGGPAAILLGVGLMATLFTGAGARQGASGAAQEPSTQSTAAMIGGAGCVVSEQGDGCLPVAAETERIDLETPTFSDPTTITNPLFPVSKLHSVVMLGTVDGLPFRSEVTLLPETKTIAWNGQQIETLASQYAGYLDGRLAEIAIDWYAQADDGSVWYFGENVYNFEDGAVANTDGTWIAGRDGPAGMIMPASPEVGDVYRPENIPGFVFEEVKVKSVGETVNGPHGPVAGAIVVTELHQDGTFEDKTFAPGYGEFLASSGADGEAVAISVPTNALQNHPQDELSTLARGAADILDAAQSADAIPSPIIADSMTAAWEEHCAGAVPTMIESEMSDALVALRQAIATRSLEETRQAAIHIAKISFDLQLQHHPTTEIDLARFDLQAHQLLVDAEAGDADAVTGDVATLEWIWERVEHSVAPSTAEHIALELDQLRMAVDRGELAAAADGAARLQDVLDAHHHVN